jgi:hypothetical protein
MKQLRTRSEALSLNRKTSPASRLAMRALLAATALIAAGMVGCELQVWGESHRSESMSFGEATSIIASDTSFDEEVMSAMTAIDRKMKARDPRPARAGQEERQGRSQRQGRPDEAPKGDWTSDVTTLFPQYDT